MLHRGGATGDRASRLPGAAPNDSLWRMTGSSTRRAVALLVTGVAVACGGGSLAAGVSEAEYVEVMAALRLVQENRSLAPAQRTARRDSILRSAGVSAEDMEAAARALARDPQRAWAAWQAIDKRATGADSVAADSGAIRR